MKIIIKQIIMLFVWVWYKIRCLFSKTQTDFSQVLILDLMGIGDVVCLTPFIRSLKNSGKFSSITGCFNKSVADLSKSFVPVDKYIYHENYLTTIKTIKKAKFDLIIIPGWGLKHTIIGLLAKAPLIGFLHDLTFSAKYINSYKLQSLACDLKTFKNHRTDMGEVHLTQRPNSILAYFGLKPIGNSIEFNYHSLKETQSNYAVFHCSADFQGRIWDLQNFKSLADNLIKEELVDKIYLIGADYDAEKYETISGPGIINLAGKKNLLETKELISQAKLFVGNDSGPMHISTFCQIPTYSLMGPNLPSISGTISSLGHNFFYKQVCCPCNQRVCNYDFRCIKAISVEEVFTKINEDYKVYYGEN